MWRLRSRSNGSSGFGFDGDEEVTGGAGEQPIDDAEVGRGRVPDEAVVAAAEPFDFELLARFDVVEAVEFDRQDDPASGCDLGLHPSNVARRLYGSISEAVEVK